MCNIIEKRERERKKGLFHFHIYSNYTYNFQNGKLTNTYNWEEKEVWGWTHHSNFDRQKKEEKWKGNGLVVDDPKKETTHKWKNQRKKEMKRLKKEEVNTHNHSIKGVG